MYSRLYKLINVQSLAEMCLQFPSADIQYI